MEDLEDPCSYKNTRDSGLGSRKSIPKGEAYYCFKDIRKNEMCDGIREDELKKVVEKCLSLNYTQDDGDMIVLMVKDYIYTIVKQGWREEAVVV